MGPLCDVRYLVPRWKEFSRKKISMGNASGCVVGFFQTCLMEVGTLHVPTILGNGASGVDGQAPLHA